MSWGDPISLGGGVISNYIQSAMLLTSGAVVPPKGTKRIEAMLCGGGGAGHSYAGGGFGGCQIYNIPVTGKQLDVVIGTGGTGAGGLGGTTSVSSASIIYAAVGGGGGGSSGTVTQARFGGCGGGMVTSGTGNPGAPPYGYANLLWSLCDVLPRGSGWNPGTFYTSNSTGLFYPQGSYGSEACLGWGGGGMGAGVGSAGAGAGGGGGAGSTAYAGLYGGGGGVGNAGGAVGGSLASLVTMWGLPGGFAGGTGFATANTGGGGGGGGILAVGSNATTAVGGAGGLGGGGGGGGTTPGNGGAGFVIFRFYL